MSKQREALEKALLALEIAPLDHNSVKSSFFEKRHYAIIALREALAEPEPWTPDDMAYRPGGLPMSAEQEPVAWMCADEDMTRKGYSRFSRNCEGDWSIPVYTAPPARKPLTDAEISAIVQSMSAHTWDAHMLARAIERAHGIGSTEQ